MNCDRIVSAWPRAEFRRLVILVSVACGPFWVQSASAQVREIKVLTFNILTGGRNFGQPLSRTIDLIEASGADIVGLQEQGGATETIAHDLDFDYHIQDGDISFLSRYPIADAFPSGVRIELAPGQDIFLFNVHLAAYPYGPYDLRDNRSLSEAELIATARRTRAAAMNRVLWTAGPYLASGAPVFLVGDFNEPSHLDWTQRAADTGLHFGRKVDWPTSNAVHAAGMADSYRTVLPDEVEFTGETWTPIQGPNEVHDRIDLLYHSGRHVEVVRAAVVGEAGSEQTDIVVEPYPSDHRAVVVEYVIDTPPGPFLRGDCNGSGDIAGVTDALFLLQFSFAGGDEPPCLAACDADADGRTLGTVTDAVYLLSYLFLGGSPPPDPFPSCGPGTVRDGEIGCRIGLENCP